MSYFKGKRAFWSVPVRGLVWLPQSRWFAMGQIDGRGAWRGRLKRPVLKWRPIVSLPNNTLGILFGRCG